MQTNCYNIRKPDGTKWRPDWSDALYSVDDNFKWVSFGDGTKPLKIYGEHDLAHVLSWSNIQTITCNLVKELITTCPNKVTQTKGELKNLINLIYEVDNDARIYTTYDETNDYLDPINGYDYILHTGTKIKGHT